MKKERSCTNWNEYVNEQEWYQFLNISNSSKFNKIARIFSEIKGREQQHKNGISVKTMLWQVLRDERDTWICI